MVILKLRKKNWSHKNPIFLGNVDMEKVLISNKYFIGYLYNGNQVKPLKTMLPKTSTYFWLKMMTY